MATGARHWCANVGHPKGLRTVEFTWVPASFIYTGPQIYNIIGCLCAGQNSLDKIWPPYDLLSAWGIPRRARCTLHMQSFGKPLNFTAVQNKKKTLFPCRGMLQNLYYLHELAGHWTAPSRFFKRSAAWRDLWRLFFCTHETFVAD